MATSDGSPGVTRLSAETLAATESRRAGEALPENEAVLRALLESASEAVIVVDGNGRIVMVSARTEEIFGYSRDELLDQPVEILMPLLLRKAHVGLRADYVAHPYIRPMGPGPDLVGRRKDGTEFPVEIGLSFIDTDGGPLILSLISDISEHVRAEEALQESDAKFHALAEAVSAMLIYQGDRMRYVNTGLEALVGYTREELLAMDFWDLVHPDFRELVKERGLARQRGKRVPPSYEVKFLRKNGEECWAEVSTSAIEFEGKPAALATAFDITERKRAEKEIRLLLSITQAVAATENLQSALGAVLREVCEAAGWDYGEAWLPHPNGTVLECSPAWHGRTDALTGFRLVSEQITFPPGAGLPGRVWSSKQPEWIEDLWVKPHTVFFRARAAQEAGLKAGLGIPITANGEVLAVLVFFVLEPREEDRRLLHLISTVSQQLGAPIQRKRAEEALRQSEEYLAKAQEIARIGSWSWDLATNTVKWSDEMYRLFDMSPDEFDGMIESVMDRIHPDDRDLLAQATDQTLVDGKPRPLEYRVVRRDGTSIVVYAEGVTHLDESGKPVSMLGTVQDITERKRSENALRDSKLLLEKTFASLDEAVFVVEPNTRTIIACNSAAERIFGYSAKDMMGRSTEFLHVDRATYENFGRKLFPSLDADGVFHTEYQMRRKDGSVLSTEHTVTEIVDDSGQRTGLVSVLRDITERRRAEERLQVAREELEGRVERQLQRRNPYGLTFREVTVLHLVAAGKSDKETGIDLGISPLTARKHISNILAKMDAASRTEAVARGLREGLLD